MPIQTTVCLQCKVKIIDTSWRPEKFHVYCSDCEEAMKIESAAQLVEDLKTESDDRLEDARCINQ